MKYSFHPDGRIEMPPLSEPCGDRVLVGETNYVDHPAIFVQCREEDCRSGVLLTLDQTRELRDQLDFLLRNHRSVRTGPITEGIEIPYEEGS